MTITLITPHQRPNSGGVDAITRFARHSAPFTEVHVVVAKGEPIAIEGVEVHGPETLAELSLPDADALLIPADMRNAEQLFGLPHTRGMPMLFFQGYGTPGDPAVHANLVLASHAVCTASWLVDEAVQAGCTATFIRYGLDRGVFSPGSAPDSRGPGVAMMTHPSDWKGTADGLEALSIARSEVPELEVRLFGKVDPSFDGATYLASPNQPSEVAALMRDCAVFVCPSWEEGFGLPGIEAIASGAALATTDTKGSRDYAFQMRTALVTAPRDPAALAQSIVTLLRDADLRRRLIEAGRQHIDAIYPGWERAGEAFVTAVHGAAATFAPPSVRSPVTADGAGADESDAVDAKLVAPRLLRELRRARVMLREAETERRELEDDLELRMSEVSQSRGQVRELRSQIQRELDARAQSESARGASDARNTVLVAEADQAKQRVAALEAEIRHVREALEAEIRDVREALEAELDETRAEAHRSQRAEAQAGRELTRLGSELELAGAQRRRLQSALARARADSQVAEAERAAFERQVVALSRRIELGEGLDHELALPGQDRTSPAGNDGGQDRTSPAGHDGGQDRSERAALAEVNRLPSAARAWPSLPAIEREEQERFKVAYREFVSEVPAGNDGRDPVAFPIPADLHHMLAVSAEDQDAGAPTVDVVVCVHDALADVRLCLWSVLHKASRRFRLILVNDGSDADTTAFLEYVAQSHPAITLIRRSDPPHGYTLAANEGLRASTSDYVVLLNSDTVVSYYWLERIVSYGERHREVGILGPLSNAATHQSVPARRAEGQWANNPVPPWLTEDGVALILDRAAPRTDTRLPFINGFCYVIRRAVLSKIGYFDEDSFPAGYSEENDYSQRARDAGFELCVVDNAYVYHARSRSYGAEVRDRFARTGYEAFLQKHGPTKIEALVNEMEADTTLDPVRTAVAEATSSPEATVAALARGAEQKLSIAFVLPGLGDGGSGGSHSVYQEVHGLRSLGAPARILLHARAWERALAAYDDAAEVFETYEDADDLATRTADANVIVATHFKSVPAVASVHRQRDDFLSAYYVQDYEPMFKFADPADNDEAAASYTAIPNTLLFAKTHWLCNLVARRHGVFVAKIEPSIDNLLFCPNDSGASPGPMRLTAMLRPRTPRRQPYSTIAVLERLVEELPSDVEIATFGCREADLATLTESPAIHANHRGVLRREQVAELLRHSDLFLDMSTYQAFGRTAVEAMACGCTAVTPRVGGIWDFAQQGVNLLAIDTCDREAAFEAVASLAHDRDRLADLKTAARASASRFSVLRAALSEYIVLLHAYEARFG